MFRLSSTTIELSNGDTCFVPAADDERDEVEFWRAEAGVAREEAVAAHRRLEIQEEHIVAVLQQTAEVKWEKESGNASAVSACSTCGVVCYTLAKPGRPFDWRGAWQ